MSAKPSFDEVVIREAYPEEMGLVRELFREYAHSLDFDLGFQNFEEELANLPGSYASPYGRILLAFCGAEAAGCVALRPFDERRCEMKRLFVRPAHRGKGVGEALIERFLEEARAIALGPHSEGAGGYYESVVLDTIQPLMSRAIAVYKKVGFREIPAYRPNPVGGALYMELELKPGFG